MNKIFNGLVMTLSHNLCQMGIIKNTLTNFSQYLKANPHNFSWHFYNLVTMQFLFILIQLLIYFWYWWD